MSSFHELLRRSEKVDVGSLFNTAARLTQAQVASKDQYHSTLLEMMFDRNLEFISQKLLDAMDFCMKEEDGRQESSDAKDQEDSPGSA